MKRSNSKTTILVIVIAVVVFALALAGINATRNIGKSAKTISTESATTSIDKMLRNIEVTYADPVKSQVDLLDTQEEDELPDIDKNEITVNEDSGLYVEIFTAPERSGSDKDGWMNEMAETRCPHIKRNLPESGTGRTLRSLRIPYGETPGKRVQRI